MSSSEEKKVQIFKRINRLKIKAGSSVDGPPIKFSKERLKNPEKFIAEQTKNYETKIKDVLKDLDVAWNKILSDNPDEIEQGREELYHKSNHAKDLAATCNYPLMMHFGMSLRDFVEGIDPASQAHQTIVKAHIDVMWTVVKDNIQDEGGAKAQELKQIVKLAIKKYS